jgi:molybdopterin-binding protein
MSRCSRDRRLTVVALAQSIDCSRATLGRSRSRKIAQSPCRLPFLIVHSKLLTPREAAQMMGVSYPTIKKRILDGRLQSIKTPGGHYRLALASLEAFQKREEAKPEPREWSPQFSGMNQLRGQVVSIRFAGLVAEVVLAMGEHKMTAIIPADAANELQLKQGDVVSALFNQTSVMVGRFGDR